MSSNVNQLSKKAQNPDHKPMAPKDPDEKGWTLSVGIYPGILFGVRTYEEKNYNTHVLYLPFFNIVLDIDK